MSDFTRIAIMTLIIGVTASVFVIVGTAMPGITDAFRHYVPMIPQNIAEFVAYILTACLEFAIILYICDRILW